MHFNYFVLSDNAEKPRKSTDLSKSEGFTEGHGV